MGIHDYLDTLDEEERTDIRLRLVKVADCREDDDLRLKFPRTSDAECKITSKADPQFNCIAYILGDKENWWWPSPSRLFTVWPEDLPPQETVETIVALFRSLGYEVCESDLFQQSFEKIAIYSRGEIPTHVALQAKGGLWKSKLGSGADIRHLTLAELESPDIDSAEWQASLDHGYSYSGFGKVALMMKRPIPGA